MTVQRRHYILIAQILISIALLTWLIHFAEPEKLLESLSNVSPIAPLLTGLGLILCNVIAALRQSVILRTLGMNVGFRRMVLLNWMGLFANNFLPSSVGGDAAIAAVLQRQFQRLAAIISALLINRIVGFVALLILLLILLLTVDLGALQMLVNRLILWSAALLFLAGAGIGLLFFLHRTDNKLSRLLAAIFSRVQIVGTTFQALWPRFFEIALLSFFTMALTGFAPAILGLWLYPSGGLFSTITIVLILQLAQLIPVSFNGIGMAESLMTYCLTRIGWPLQEAVLFGLILRAVSVGVSLPGALVFLLPAAKSAAKRES